MTRPADASRPDDPAEDLLDAARKVADHASAHLTFEGRLTAAGLDDLRRAYIRAAGAGGHGPVAELLAWPLLARLEEAGPGQEAEALRAGIAGHYRRAHALEEAPFGLVRELAWRTGMNGDWPKASPSADRATASGDPDLALQAFRLDPRGTQFALGPALEAAGRPAEAIDIYRWFYDAYLMEGAGHAGGARAALGLSRACAALGQSEEAARFLDAARGHLREEIAEERQEDPCGFCTGVLANDLPEVLTEAGLHDEARALAREVLALLEAAAADGFRDRAGGFRPQDAPGVAEDIGHLRGWLARQWG